MRAKVIFDSGDTLTLEENGDVVGEARSIKGAITFSKKGRKVDAYFLREVLLTPDAIPWKFRDGSQRTRLYDAEGAFLAGNYIVVKGDDQQA